MNKYQVKPETGDFKPSLCFVGHMLGRNPGHVTTQGQVVADLFSNDGYSVTSTSSKQNRFFRLLDVIVTIFRVRKKTDVLIIEVYSGLSFVLADVASLTGNLLRIPLILVLHGGGLPVFANRKSNWVRRVLRRADILVAPSSYLADEISRHGFAVKVIPNTLDLKTYSGRIRNEVSPKLIWMRSFHPTYNPKMALDAVAAIKTEYPDSTLVMAGRDKGLETDVKDYAYRMGLRESVRFPGFLDEASKRREFSEADIYLNTNQIDNMPVSVLEAFAMGLPVVATDVGGISHLLTHEKDGLIVRQGDWKAMADAIRRLLANPDLASRLSRNGRVAAENCSWISVKIRWQSLFQELRDGEVFSSKFRKSE